MLTLPPLNRRHKAGLFLVLVAAGLSLFFEASTKQTAGIVLLGLAATWLIGSLRLRVLWLLSNVIACGLGIYVAGKPVLNDWNSVHDSAANYDRALSDIRQAVALSRQQQDFTNIRPLGHIRVEDEKGVVHVFPDGSTPEMIAQAMGVKTQSQPLFDMSKATPIFDRTAAKAARHPPRDVQIPTHHVENWLRRYDSGWARAVDGTTVSIPFPADASEEAIMAEFQTKHLLPKPTYSTAAAISANRGTVLSGVVVFALGLLGFAGMLWRERKAKQMATGLPG